MDLEKIMQWLTTLTWPKLALALVAVTSGITMYTLYENRQKVFEFQTGARGQADDFELMAPTKDGKAIFEAFLKLHPEVAYIALVDANPLSNRRITVARFYNDKEIQGIIENATRDTPSLGDGPLLTADPILNKQVLAILAGEFYCDPAKDGVIAKVFPEAAKRLSYTCRVPLPPAFNKATGWLAIHLNKWPSDDLEKFKIDALTLSLSYYNAGILKQSIRSAR